jgi:hypothetical protein
MPAPRSTRAGSILSIQSATARCSAALPQFLIALARCDITTTFPRTYPIHGLTRSSDGELSVPILPTDRMSGMPSTGHASGTFMSARVMSQGIPFFFARSRAPNKRPRTGLFLRSRVAFFRFFNFNFSGYFKKYRFLASRFNLRRRSSFVSKKTESNASGATTPTVSEGTGTPGRRGGMNPYEMNPRKMGREVRFLTRVPHSPAGAERTPHPHPGLGVPGCLGSCNSLRRTTFDRGTLLDSYLFGSYH